MKNKKWGITKIWNESLVTEQRKVEPRSHMWATDLGKDFWERYQKMMGVAFTEPYDERTLRKFAAGNFFEDLIAYVLKKVGILQSAQEWVEIPETKDHLRITGKMDLKAGGITDWKEAEKNVKEAEFPEAIEKIALNLVEHFAKEYPEGLTNKIIEVKSVNSQVFWAKKDYLNEAYPHHELQLYMYLRALKDISEGCVFYISKDDLTVAEMPVIYPNPRLEAKFLKDVKEMSEYYRNKKEPEKPDNVIFDPRKKLRFQWNKEKHIIQGCYTDNWQVKWSPYLTMLTDGMKLEQWEGVVRQQVAEKNAQLKEMYKSKKQ